MGGTVFPPYSLASGQGYGKGKSSIGDLLQKDLGQQATSSRTVVISASASFPSPRPHRRCWWWWWSSGSPGCPTTSSISGLSLGCSRWPPPPSSSGSLPTAWPTATPPWTPSFTPFSPKTSGRLISKCSSAKPARSHLLMTLKKIKVD